MNGKNVELKVPIDIISKVDQVRKSTKWYARMPFSEYFQMIVLRGVEYEKQRIEEFQNMNTDDDTVIMFPHE
jgi:hypothetical protein